LGDLHGAQDCVRTVLATPSPQAGRFVLVEAFLCDAQIAQLKGEPDRALETLTRALDIARGEVVLPFLRMKDTFAALLARHPAISGEWPVPRPRTPAEEVPKPAISRELSAPLTQRELTILRLLATSMSTSEIADELCLSVNTVKSHLAAIYRKLPASRRREAVLRARQLELI
jgi:LuxR family maltose regulon positive regulatory protein